MPQSTPTISILTPMYNGERHLAECIESVRAQTFTDWEYIIVDNCSTDSSARIADRYAAIDRRISVVRCTDFFNVHNNFNRAARLMNAHSRYCKFVSADDWIYPECLERMMAVAERHPGVGIVSSYQLVNDYVGNDGLLPYTRETLPGTEAVRAALQLDRKYILGSPTQLLMRSDLVRRTEPFYDETVFHSDAHAGLRTLMNSDLGFVHQVLTFTRAHTNTITSTSYRLNTDTPTQIRLLIQFGPHVFPPKQYRSIMRTWLYRYARYLGKRSLRPSRFNDPRHHPFHRHQLACMLNELKQDPETTAVLRTLTVLTRNGVSG